MLYWGFRDHALFGYLHVPAVSRDIDARRLAQGAEDVVELLVTVEVAHDGDVAHLGLGERHVDVVPLGQQRLDM